MAAERPEPFRIAEYAEDVGKHLKLSKTMYKWMFSFGAEGEEQVVQLKLSGISGKKELKYNGKLILQTQAFDTSRFQHTWLEDGRQFQIGSVRREDGAPVENASVASLSSMKYTFAIDGVAFENFKYRGFGAAPPATPTEQPIDGAVDRTTFSGSNPAFGEENFGTFGADASGAAGATSPGHVPKQSLDLLGDFAGLSAEAPSPQAAAAPAGFDAFAPGGFGAPAAAGATSAEEEKKRRTSWSDLHEKGLVDENDILGARKELEQNEKAEPKSLSLAQIAEKQRKEKAAALTMTFGAGANSVDPFAAPAAQQSPQPATSFNAFGQQPAPAPAPAPMQQNFGMAQPGFGAPQPTFGSPQGQFGQQQQMFGQPASPQPQFGQPFGAQQAMPGMQPGMPAYGNPGVAPQQPNVGYGGGYGGAYGVPAGGASAISSMGPSAISPGMMTAPVVQQQQPPKRDVNINPFDNF